MEPETSPAGTRGVVGSVFAPFLLLGVAAIIAGGLFSAATARLASYEFAWLVAYLVLVVGVAQVALGAGESTLSGYEPRGRFIASQLLLFNFGNVGVIVGTLLGRALWVDIGSVLLVAALVLFVWAVRLPRRRGLALWGYRALIVLLLVSVMIGLFFAHFGAP